MADGCGVPCCVKKGVGVCRGVCVCGWGGVCLDVMYVMLLSPGKICFAEPKSASLTMPV